MVKGEIEKKKAKKKKKKKKTDRKGTSSQSNLIIFRCKKIKEIGISATQDQYKMMEHLK
jgi:hypothetical protein